MLPRTFRGGGSQDNFSLSPQLRRMQVGMLNLCDLIFRNGFIVDMMQCSILYMSLVKYVSLQLRWLIPKKLGTELYYINSSGQPVIHERLDLAFLWSAGNCLIEAWELYEAQFNKRNDDHIIVWGRKHMTTTVLISYSNFSSTIRE